MTERKMAALEFILLRMRLTPIQRKQHEYIME